MSLDPEDRPNASEAYNHNWLLQLDHEEARSMRQKMYYEQKFHVYVDDYNFNTKLASLIATALLLTQKIQKGNLDNSKEKNLKSDKPTQDKRQQKNNKKKRRKSILEAIGVVKSSSNNKSIYVGDSKIPPSSDYELVKTKALRLNKYLSKIIGGKITLSDRVTVADFMRYCDDEATRNDIRFHDDFSSENSINFFETKFTQFLTYNSNNTTVLKIEIIAALLRLKDEIANFEIAHRSYASLLDIEEEDGTEDIFDWPKSKGIINEIVKEIKPEYDASMKSFQSSHLEFRYKVIDRGEEWFRAQLCSDDIVDGEGNAGESDDRESDDRKSDDGESDDRKSDDGESDDGDSSSGYNHAQDDADSDDEVQSSDNEIDEKLEVNIYIPDREEIVISTIAPWLATERDHELTTKVQACFRGIKERKMYRKQRKAAITMQSNIRGYFQRINYPNLNQKLQQVGKKMDLRTLK